MVNFSSHQHFSAITDSEITRDLKCTGDFEYVLYLISHVNSTKDVKITSRHLRKCGDFVKHACLSIYYIRTSYSE